MDASGDSARTLSLLARKGDAGDVDAGRTVPTVALGGQGGELGAQFGGRPRAEPAPERWTVVSQWEPGRPAVRCARALARRRHACPSGGSMGSNSLVIRTLSVFSTLDGPRIV